MVAFPKCSTPMAENLNCGAESSDFTAYFVYFVPVICMSEGRLQGNGFRVVMVTEVLAYCDEMH